MNKTDIDWAPCLELGHSKSREKEVANADERAKRAQTRRKKSEESLLLAEEPSSSVDKVIQTDNVTTPSVSRGTQVESDFFDEKIFLLDNKKVLYYTGLPNAELLLSTFEFVMKLTAFGERRSFYWRSFLLVLIKLRLNLGFQDLAFRMGISISTVSRRFHEALDVMAVRLKFLIHWPEREELRKTMPMCFRPAYGLKVVAIVDCYEVRIDKPSHFVAKSATWSQYKHSNTVKVFIAISPQGVTTFISQAWGGRTSDKHLTVCSGFCQKLLPGDIILADRGFDISEDVARMQASLRIPAFTKGCTQLNPMDIEETRQLANVRIHIERVIGATRQRYSILMSTLPIEFVKPKLPGEEAVIDKIILVCSALNNLCMSVVPFE